MRLFYLFGGMLILFLSSCADIYEDVYFQEDGSGRVEYSVNLYNSLNTLNSFASSMDSDSSKSKTEGKDIFASMLKNSKNDKFDTTFSFFDALKDSIVDPEKIGLLKKSSMGFHIDKTKEEANFIFKLGFNNTNQLNNMLGEILKESLSPKDTSNKAMPFMDMMAGSSKNDVFSFSKKQFERHSTPLPKKEEENKDPKDKAMMQMMFANNKYITRYHFPKKIKSANLKEAEIKGKDLIIERSLIEGMMNPKEEHLKVKFK